MRETRLTFFALCVVAVMSSCSSILNAGRSSVLVTNESRVSLRVVPDDTDIPISTMGGNHGMTEYKLRNDHEYYMVNQTKTGHLSNATPLLRTRKNNLRLFDFIIPVGISIGLVETVESDELKPVAGALLIPLGILVGFSTPKFFYEDKYSLPSLYEIPTFEEYTNFNLVPSAINVDSAQFRVLSYYSAQRYMDNIPRIESFEYEIRNATNSQIISEVEQLFGYEDKKQASLIDVSIGLKMSISQVDLTIININYDEVFKIDITSIWSWIDGATGKLVGDTLQTESSWAALNASSDLDYDVSKVIQQEYINAVAKAIIDMGNSPNYKPVKSNSNFLEILSEEWDPLKIDTEELSDSVTKKSDAVQAVVTIHNDHGHGSGCVISSDGYIITNDHVIQGAEGAELFAAFANGQNWPVTVIRSNPFTDLALVKVDTTGLRPLQLCFDAELGEQVFAIGTPADKSFGQSLTGGIISGVRSTGESRVLQTDVSISPGISGGALINEGGKLIGVLRMKIVGKGAEGLGFAIPVEEIASSLKLELN